MYFFKNYMQENCILSFRKKKILVQLEELSFHRVITLTRLNNLYYSVRRPVQSPQKNSFYVFSDCERELLSIEYHRFPLTLEQQNILNSYTRVLAINQVIKLLTEDLDMNVIKLVVLIMVLFNQYDKTGSRKYEIISP